MENYKIGIKLADGSFYPILEEGKPQVQTIELTTVRDDQTTVQLDLYRSSSDNMEDAEYVDTLLVENLLPRPKETPTLNLKIEIDSENVLSASIEDCESGEHSETKVSLVTLDSSERTIVPDFSMIDSESSDNINGDALLDEFADNTIATQEEVVDNELSKDDELNLDDFGDMDELITEDNSENVNNFIEESEVSEEIEAMPALDDMPDFAEDTAETSEEVEATPALDDMPDFADDTEEVSVESSEEVEEMPELDDMPDFAEDTEESSEEVDEMPELDDMPDFAEDTEETSEEVEDMPALDDMPDFADETVETSEEVDEMPALDDMPDFADDTVETSEEVEDMPALDDMPDFAEDTVETSEEIDDMPELDIPVTDDIDESNGFQSDIMQDSILDNDFNSEESSLDEEEFPDFGDIATSEPEENQIDDDNDDGFFGIGNDFGSIDEEINLDESDDVFAANLDTSGDLDESIPSPDLSFSDLYVDTEEDNDCPEKKRCSIPVLICSICAVICVIALLLILFLTPSKLKDKNVSEENSIWAKEETSVENVVPVPVETEVEESNQEIDEFVEEQAKEDEIVIVEAPTVTPVEPEPIKEEVKGVEYKVKWGDTLWDIAGTYYKNPWLYPVIAEYNKLENPDYIISGTIITIPPR